MDDVKHSICSTSRLLPAKLSVVKLVNIGPVCDSQRATLQTHVPPKAPHMSSVHTNSSPSFFSCGGGVREEELGRRRWGGDENTRPVAMRREWEEE